LKYIVPACGVISANLIFISPFQTVLGVRKDNVLGSLNPLPYPMIVANCLSWLCYSFVVKDWFVYFANIFGFVLGVFYTTSCRACSETSASSAKVMDILFLGGQAFVLGGASIALIALRNDPKAAQTMMGVVCMIVLVCFYTSPLSVLYKVVTTRNSASLHIPLAIASFANGSLWSIYGFVLGDIFIWGPNALGAVFSGLQLVLIMILPRTPEIDDDKGPSQISILRH